MACKRSGVQIPLAPRETAGQGLFTCRVAAGAIRRKAATSAATEPNREAVDEVGYWSAEVPEGAAGFRRVGTKFLTYPRFPHARRIGRVNVPYSKPISGRTPLEPAPVVTGGGGNGLNKAQ